MLIWLAAVVALAAGCRCLPRMVRAVMFVFCALPVWLEIADAAKAWGGFSYGLACWLSGMVWFGGTMVCAMWRTPAWGGSEPTAGSEPRKRPAAATKPASRGTVRPEPLRRRFRFDEEALNACDLLRCLPPCNGKPGGQCVAKGYDLERERGKGARLSCLRAK